MENFCALSPGLTGAATKVDAGVATCENRWLLERLRACSGCAGDYEDPDRTAWTEEGAEDEEAAAEPRAPGYDFPVQCT